MRYQTLRHSIIFISLLSFFCVMCWIAHRRAAAAQQKVIIDSNSPRTIANAANRIGGLNSDSTVAAAPTLTGIFFVSTRYATGTQTIIFSGTGFQAGLTLTVTPESGMTSTFAGSQIQSQTATSFQVTMTLPTQGFYQFRVTNPSGDLSNRFAVFVLAPTASWWTPEGARLTDVTAGFPGVSIADVAAFQLRDGRWRLLLDTGRAIRSAVSPDGLSLTMESGTRLPTRTTDGQSIRPAGVKVLKLDTGQLRAYFNGGGRAGGEHV